MKLKAAKYQYTTVRLVTGSTTTKSCKAVKVSNFNFWNFQNNKAEIKCYRKYTKYKQQLHNYYITSGQKINN